MYCRPILKREEHRQRLVEAATSGKPYFFAGSDSAPHSVGSKESACGCAGVFTAHASTCLPLLLLERLSHDLTLTQPLLPPHRHLAGTALYAEAFASVDKLGRLNAFMSEYGRKFYGLAGATDSSNSTNSTDTALVNNTRSCASISAGAGAGAGAGVDVLVLVKRPWKVPPTYEFGSSVVVPLRAGEDVQWTVERGAGTRGV